MSEIRYLKITLVDGMRFILRVTGETPLVIRGYEVNAEGDEVVPAGYERRLRVVGRDSVKRAVELRMSKKYATLVPRGEDAAKARLVNIVTDTSKLAEVMYPGGLDVFNVGVYEGTRTPIRKLTGREVVTVAGTTAGAKVLADETWIADRFGRLGARQIQALRDLVTKANGQ